MRVKSDISVNIWTQVGKIIQIPPWPGRGAEVLP